MSIFDGKKHKFDNGKKRGAVRLMTDNEVLSLKWCTVSTCPPQRTEYLWETITEALEALDQINETGCGGQCLGEAHHQLGAIDRKGVVSVIVTPHGDVYHIKRNDRECYCGYNYDINMGVEKDISEVPNRRICKPCVARLQQVSDTP